MNSCGNIPVVVQNVSELPSAMFSAGCSGSLEVARTRAAPAELRHQSAAPIAGRELRGRPSPVPPVPGSGDAPEHRGCGRASRCRSGTPVGWGGGYRGNGAGASPRSPPRSRFPSAPRSQPRSPPAARPRRGPACCRRRCGMGAASAAPADGAAGRPRRGRTGRGECRAGSAQKAVWIPGQYTCVKMGSCTW